MIFTDVNALFDLRPPNPSIAGTLSERYRYERHEHGTDMTRSLGFLFFPFSLLHLLSAINFLSFIW